MPVTVVTAAADRRLRPVRDHPDERDGEERGSHLFQVNGPVGLANWKDYCYDLSGCHICTQLTSDSSH